MGRYAKIKAYTDVAISWVIETAQAHESPVHTIGAHGSEVTASISAVNPKSGRLNGRARKEAKLQQ